MKIGLKFVTFHFLLITQVLATLNAFRILGIFPLPAISHANYNNVIMKSLAAAGHEVVVVTPFPDHSSLRDCTVIDFSANMTIFVNHIPANLFSEITMHQTMNTLSELDKEYCDKLIKREEIIAMFTNENKPFDAIFVEMLALYECYLPLAQKWNIPVIGTSTMRTWSTPEKAIHTPRFPSVIPIELNGSGCHMSSFYGRLENTLSHIWNELTLLYLLIKRGNEFYEEKVCVLEPYSEYRKRKPSLVFFNDHFSLFPRSVSPNAIGIGGIHIEDIKPLPTNIRTFIEEAKHGVILFTLGTVANASTLPAETQLAFIEVFRSIPQRVIWKYETQLNNVPNNVLLLPWIPQADIIAHHNVKAVISHSGLSGTYEIIHSAKPVITIPLFTDQWSNACALRNKGAAINLDLNSINKEIILNAVNNIINDTRYLSNMRKLSREFKDRPMSPQEAVVYWTEFVIAHNGTAFRETSATSDLWPFQYLLIDVLVCAIIIFALVSYTIKWILTKCLMCIFKLSKFRYKRL